RSRSLLKKLILLCVLVAGVGALFWYFRTPDLPEYAPSYREYAYVSNGKSNTVSVLDLTPRPYPRFNVIRTIRVGANPTGVAVNSRKNEIYVVNTESNNVSVIDAERNQLVATIGVHRAPYFISVADDGRRAYVANSGSANV